MSTTPDPVSPEVDEALLAGTITATCTAIFERFGPEGRFLSPGDSGLTSTLYVIATLHFLGRLDPALTRGAARTILGEQLPHGAFPNYPGDPNGDPWVTGLAAAVLRLAPDPSHEEAIARAERYIDLAGGEDLVGAGLYRLNINPLYMAMAGQLDPAALPDVHAEPLLLHAVVEGARHHVNAELLWMGVALWAILRELRDPGGRKSPSWLESLERKRALEVMDPFQNGALGSFNANVMQTTIAAAAYHCLGVADDDPRLVKALTWLSHAGGHRAQGPRAQGSEEVSFHQFHTSVWTTALLVRALLSAGVPRSDPHVARAVSWLVESQVNDDLPELVPTPPGAPRQGGWSFEAFNTTVPDADDTAVVLGALGLALQGQGADRLDAATEERARASAERGLAFLLGMQNPDGGWPAFQQGLPGKPRGPILVTYPCFERGHLLQELRAAYKNALVFGDPATEDITGRTLFALAQLGYTRESPVVRRAIDFLIAQQCTQEDLGGGWEHAGGGPWWSRWIANYLVGTAYVLGGLVAVGVDPAEPFVRRAIDWTLRRQNADGGWGEGPDSYRDPRRAGQGPSMPVTTAVVLCGLIQAGEGRSAAVRRGIAHLLGYQRDEQGMWPDQGPLHVFYRTDTFYTFTGARYYYPLEALGRYRELIAGRAPDRAVGDRTAASIARAEGAGDEPSRAASPRDSSGRWSAEGLEQMRSSGDPDADAVVRAIFETGHLPAVNDLFARIVRNDDPVPAGLPQVAADYFERTAKLPDWADPDQLARASLMFRRAGWAAAIALFNAALPQCYAMAKGARVLAGTRGLVDVPERRILETAQFLFDVTGSDAFAPGGTGIRAAQKVRLLHAAIRHLTLAQATWDMEWGVPINQEDEALTLLSFALVIVQAWKKMGIPFTDADDAAWLHLWKVVGHVMGIHPALLPTGVADAQALWDEITRAQWAPSDAGRELTRALVSVGDRYLPHLAGANLPSTMIRFFSGDTCGDLLGLPPADWSSALLRATPHVEALGGDPDQASGVVALLRAAGYDMMKAIVSLKRAGKETRFRIPPALLHEWNLRD